MALTAALPAQAVIQPIQELAQFYSVPHLDQHTVLSQLFNGPVEQQDADAGYLPAYPPSHTDTLERVRFASQFFKDAVHPRRDRLSVLLASDLINFFLYSSQV